MHTVYSTLAKLGIQDKTIVTAFNKQDILDEEQILKDFRADYTVKISARTGNNIDVLLETIEKILNERKILIERVFSYQEAGKIQVIRKYGQLLEEEYQQEGIFIKAYVPKEVYQSL
jgi:GTP-binding protein HflX